MHCQTEAWVIYTCMSDLDFCYLAVVGLGMGGAEPRVSSDLLPFTNEDQLEQTERYTDVYTQTHKHALSSGSSSCRKHLERSDAHM